MCRFNDRAGAIDVAPDDETAVDRFLPDGETRTGGAPGLHYLAIGPGSLSDPFDEIENEGHWGIVHCLLRNAKAVTNPE
jgi:hypothetical protein